LRRRTTSYGAGSDCMHETSPSSGAAVMAQHSAAQGGRSRFAFPSAASLHYFTRNLSFERLTPGPSSFPTTLSECWRAIPAQWPRTSWKNRPQQK
jgi:hypothetical protein